jgi:hypothetical protein
MSLKASHDVCPVLPLSCREWSSLFVSTNHNGETIRVDQKLMAPDLVLARFDAALELAGAEIKRSGAVESAIWNLASRLFADDQTGATKQVFEPANDNPLSQSTCDSGDDTLAIA